MLALVVQMNTAREINFLDTNLFYEEPTSTWSLSQWLGKTSLFSRYARSKSAAPQMMAYEGGFVFEQEKVFNLSLPAGLTSGIVGMSVFMLIGSLIASETLSTTVLARAIEATRISTATAINTTTKSAALNAEITPKEKQVSAKKSTPSSSTSTVGTSAVESIAPKPAEPQLKRDVFGFLPYWFVDSAANNLDFSLLSTLAYFDIPLNSDGSLDTLSNGWKKLHTSTTQDVLARAKSSGTRVVLTYSTFDNGIIESISTNEQARISAITNMVNFAKSQGVQGANIDFEYVGDPGPTVREGFSHFVRQATERFHAEIPGSEVTVSMYAISAQTERLYQVNALADVSDGLFIMAYDFYTVGSSNAGPVAPLTGAPGTYWYDITTSLNDFAAAGVPENKLILGVPYYGYDWPTVDHSPKSAVLPGSKNTANYSGVQRVLAAGEGERRWDYEAQVPYLVYQEDGVNRIAYYDDAESLGKKYDVVNQRSLKGVGIWALGQDGDHKELWDLLRTKFSHE